MMKFAFAILPLAVHGLKPRFNEDGEVDKESKSTRSEIETNPTPVQPVRSVGFGGDLGGLRPQPVQHDPRPLGGDPKGSLQSFGGDLGGQVDPTPTDEELRLAELRRRGQEGGVDEVQQQDGVVRISQEQWESLQGQFAHEILTEGLKHPFALKLMQSFNLHTQEQVRHAVSAGEQHAFSAGEIKVVKPLQDALERVDPEATSQLLGVTEEELKALVLYAQQNSRQVFEKMCGDNEVCHSALKTAKEFVEEARKEEARLEAEAKAKRAAAEQEIARLAEAAVEKKEKETAAADDTVIVPAPPATGAATGTQGEQ